MPMYLKMEISTTQRKSTNTFHRLRELECSKIALTGFMIRQPMPIPQMQKNLHHERLGS